MGESLHYIDKIIIVVIQYIYGSIVQYRAAESLKPRVLNDYLFVHILRGYPIYLVDGRRYHLQPGSIHFAKPGAHEEYLWDHQSSTLHSYFHFNFDCLPDDIPPVGKWPQIHEQAAPVLRYTMEQIVAQLVQGRGQPTALSPAFCRLFEVFVSLYNQHIDTRIQLESELPSAIQKSLFAMRESIDHAQTGMIDLQSLAQQAAVTPGHLCKVFQRHLGRSPMQVYWLLQLQFSLSLLIRSGLSIQEIAWRCDFSDPLYYSRYFKKKLGKSPSRVRKELAAGVPPPDVPLPQQINPARSWNS